MALTEERYQEIRRIVIERRRQREEDQRQLEERLEKMIAAIKAELDAVTDEEFEDFLFNVGDPPEKLLPKQSRRKRR